MAAKLPAALRQMAAEHGQRLACDRSMVSRWLSGTMPRPSMPALLLEVLSRRLQRPVGPVEAGLSRAPSEVLDLSWEAEPMRRLSALTHADLDPARRQLLGAGVFSLAALAVPASWQSRENPLTGQSPGSSLARGRAGRAEAEQIQTMARVFAEATEAHGPGHVRTGLVLGAAMVDVPLMSPICPSPTSASRGNLSWPHPFPAGSATRSRNQTGTEIDNQP